MTDDELEPVELTGRWVGISHRWEKFERYPIIADLRQTGDNIRGEMYDQMRSRSDYFGNSVVILGEQIPIDTRRKLEQVIKQFGTETVPNSRLPVISEIRERSRGARSGSQRTTGGWRPLGLPGRSKSGPSGEIGIRFNTLVTSIVIGGASWERGSSGERVSSGGFCHSNLGAALSCTGSLEGGTTKRAGMPLCRYQEVPQLR